MIRAKELLEMVTSEVVIEIMKENGSPLYNTTTDGATGQKLLWFKTICHGGSKPKLCYFTQSKSFFCYTSCGHMGFFECVKRIRNAKEDEFYSKVILYVAEKLGISRDSNRYGFNSKYERVTLGDIEVWDNYDESVRRIERLESYKNLQKKVYDETILNYFENLYYSGWIDEGISIESMQKFGIKWYEYKECIVIPHRDENGNLIGIRRRSFRPEDANNKYMPLQVQEMTFEHSLGNNLYGLYENKEAISKKRKAIIVEGEKSVLLSDTFFGKNSIAVATCGFNISDAQANLLSDLGVNDIYLGFDKDFDEHKEELYKKDKDVYANYLRYKNRLDTIAERLNNTFNVRLLKDINGQLGEKDSPFDKGKDVFDIIYKNANSRKMVTSNKHKDSVIINKRKILA